MATITLEVPDELAARLEQIGDQLPTVLAAALYNQTLMMPDDAFVTNQAWREVIDFLAHAPDVQSILDFKLSDELQDRIEELIFLGSAGTQTPQERAELDGYVQVIQFFDLLKAHLRANLA